MPDFTIVAIFRLKTDGKSIIVTRRFGKNNVFHLWGISDCHFVLRISYSLAIARFPHW